MFSHEDIAVEVCASILDTTWISYVESFEVSIQVELHRCYISYQFLGEFAQPRKATTTTCPFALPSVPIYHHGSQWTDVLEILYRGLLLKFVENFFFFTIERKYREHCMRT